MLPSTSDYALRAVLVLARNPAGHAVSTDELVRATDDSGTQLAVTLATLVRAGIVRSAPEKSEGFVLAVPAERLSLARIVDCFEELPPPPCPPGTVKCDPLRPCASHDGWPKLVAARREMLAMTTVADLLAGGRTAEPAPREATPKHSSTLAWRTVARDASRPMATFTPFATTQVMPFQLEHHSRHPVSRFVVTLLLALAALLMALSLTA